MTLNLHKKDGFSARTKKAVYMRKINYIKQEIQRAHINGKMFRARQLEMELEKLKANPPKDFQV